MKAHISESRTKLEAAIKARLLEYKQSGLAEGCKAISTVIYEKATDESRSYEERIRDIISFCETGLAIKGEEKAMKKEEQSDV